MNTRRVRRRDSSEDMEQTHTKCKMSKVNEYGSGNSTINWADDTIEQDTDTLYNKLQIPLLILAFLIYTVIAVVGIYVEVD